MSTLKELKDKLIEIENEIEHIERITYDDDEDQWNKHRYLCYERGRVSTEIEWNNALAKFNLRED